MRGHTNNRVLAAALAALIRNSNADAARRPDDDPSKEFCLGRADAAEEVAILMGLSEEVKALVA